jgi:glutamate synthase (NADPH/NADH) small chain
LAINQPAVTIKEIEVSIIDDAFDNGWVQAHAPERLTGKTVAVVGSGPAGLAAAQQLARAGHTVAVFEKDDRIGGLLRYGIPDFKMEKHHIDRRLAQLEAEGVRFRVGIEIGKDISWSDLRRRYDAVLIATGASLPRDLAVKGRELAGVHFAMEYLTQANRAVALLPVAEQISAAGKKVVILGGGDTGADCLGTATRQGAVSVTTLAIGQKPPEQRPDSQPWPTSPVLYEVSSAHEEFGERKYLSSTVELVGEDGKVTGIKVADTQFVDGKRIPTPGTERVFEADLVLLALGFSGPEVEPCVSEIGIALDENGIFVRKDSFASEVEGVFVAGDAGRGQCGRGGANRAGDFDVDWRFICAGKPVAAGRALSWAGAQQPPHNGARADRMARGAGLWRGGPAIRAGLRSASGGDGGAIIICPKRMV